jgi:N4-gp56 family major capsid protein
MATYPKTQFSTNDALTRKKWARDLFSILLKAIEFNDLVGTSDTSVVQLRKELGKGEGDTIKFGIRLPLTQEGIVGYDTVEGNEEKLIFRDFSTTIEELNFAVDTGGKMEEQRIPYNLLEIGKTALQERWADRLSDLMFAHLCGDTTFKVNSKTFAQDPSAPDTYHHMKVNDVAEASMTAADELDLSFLDRMKQAAEAPDTTTWGTDHYRVRPLVIGGKKYYRVILHNYVFDRLRTNMNVGQWGDLQRAAQKLAVPNVEFEYNGMLVSKSERIRSLVTNVYRNILLGSQAAVLAWGGAGESKSTTMSFVPYTKDAERYVMIRGGGILGIKKVVFNSKDYGVITGASYATKLS